MIAHAPLTEIRLTCGEATLQYSTVKGRVYQCAVNYIILKPLTRPRLIVSPTGTILFAALRMAGWESDFAIVLPILPWKERGFVARPLGLLARVRYEGNSAEDGAFGEHFCGVGRVFEGHQALQHWRQDAVRGQLDSPLQGLARDA